MLLVASALVFSGCLGGKTGHTPYAVSGRVLDQFGDGIEGVNLEFTGGVTGSATTNADGKWKASFKGTVNVTPSKTGYKFTPGTLRISAASQKIDFTGSESDSEQLIISDRTKVLDEASADDISQITETAIIFRKGIEPGLQKDDVLVFGVTSLTPYGLLRKVVSTEKANGEFIVHTEQATLGDVFIQGDLRFDLTVGYDQLEQDQIFSLGDCESLGRSEDGGFRLPLDLSLKAGLELTESVLAIGPMQFETQVNTRHGRVEYFRHVRTKTIALDLHVNVFADLDFYERVLFEKELGPFRPWIFTVGWVPVVVVPKVTVELKFSATAQSQTEFDAALRAELYGGLEYGSGLGFKVVGGGNLDGSGIGNTRGNVGVETALKASVKGECLLYGVPGYYGELSAGPALELSSQEQGLTLKAVAQAEVGLEARVFDWALLDTKLEIFKYEVPVFRLGPGPRNYALSGHVTTADGNGIAGVVLSFSSGYGSATTGPQGNWSREGLNGPVEVAPFKRGYSFYPTFITADRASDVVNFIGTPEGEPYSIQGQIKDAYGRGMRNVTLFFGEGIEPITTANDGTWQKGDLDGPVIVRPHKEDFSFEPSSIDANGSRNDVDFIATPLRLFSGGDGTSQSPYLLSSADELDSMRYFLDCYFMQIADIDMQDYSYGANWVPIGDNTTPFTGNFDGQDFTIYNLTVHHPNRNYVGLFGKTDNCSLANVHLRDADIYGSSYVGGLTGYNAERGVITGCFASGTMTGVRENIGGLVGLNQGTIATSHTNVNVRGEINVGGFAGVNQGGTIRDCYAVSNASTWIYAGGFAAQNPFGLIERCYAVASVRGYAAHPFVRIGPSGRILSSYYACSDPENSPPGEGVPKTAEQMMQRSTFIEWDFDSIWNIDEGRSYPYLRRF